MASEHWVDDEAFHNRWDNSLAPTLEVDPGDIVHLRTREVSNGQITPGCSVDVLDRLDGRLSYPLAGPIFVRGAEPGDALVVELLAIRLEDWAWTGIFPGRGLLKDEFTRPYLHHWDLSNGRTTRLRPGIEVPLDPFPGTIGVAPREPGSHPVAPPGVFGGNMDIRDLRAGTTLFLPVQVVGALFSAGDGHAAQGDGEVCMTGLEAPMRLTLRLGLAKGTILTTPRFVTSGPPTAIGSSGYEVTTGIGPNLYANAQHAVSAMVAWLRTERGLSPEEAYVLCSAVGDLRISEIVDEPNWVVSFALPRSVFTT